MTSQKDDQRQVLSEARRGYVYCIVVKYVFCKYFAVNVSHGTCFINSNGI